MSSPEQRILDAIKSFAGDHPELVSAVTAAAEAGAAAAVTPASPFSIYDILRAVAHTLFGADKHMLAKARDAINRHEAEHAAAAAAHPARDSSGAAAATAPEPPAPASPAAAAVMPDPRDTEIAALRAQVAQLEHAPATTVPAPAAAPETPSFPPAG